MNSENVRNVIFGLITKTETCCEVQRQVNNIYDEFCELIISEITEQTPKYDWSQKSREKLRFHTHFWNDELTKLWKKMLDIENLSEL